MLVYQRVYILTPQPSIPDDEQGAARVDQPAAHGLMAGFVDCFCGTHTVAMFNVQAMNWLPSIPQFESSKWI